MKRNLRAYLPFLVFGLMFPGIVHSQGLQEEVRKRLARMSEFGAFDWITFRVDGPNVTLMGFASRPSVKVSAEKVVYKVSGVELVENQIEVLPTSGSDDNLRLRAYNAIYTHSALQRYAPGGGISPNRYWRDVASASYWGIDSAMYTRGPHAVHIIVKNGHITLYGNLNTELEKQVAETQVRQLSGVFSVTNEIQVSSGG